MKKILLVALFAIVAIGASAQKNITIWWGGNVSDVDGDFNTKSEFKALNIGVSYTAPIDNSFDWSVGAAYVTKDARTGIRASYSSKETVRGTSLRAATPKLASSPVRM